MPVRAPLVNGFNYQHYLRRARVPMQRGRLGPPSAPRQLQGFDGVRAPPGTADGSQPSFSRPPSSTGNASDFGPASSDHPGSSGALQMPAGNDGSANAARIPRFGATASSTYSEHHGAAPAPISDLSGGDKVRAGGLLHHEHSAFSIMVLMEQVFSWLYKGF